MKLTTAMVADAAHVANGKLYVLGGQWDRLGAMSFPVQHPSMALVLVVEVDYSEALEPHTLQASLMIDGQPQGSSAVGQVTTGHAPGLARGAPTYVPLALPFSNLTFERPGRYEWVINVDDLQLGQLPIEVFQVQSLGIPPGVVPMPPIG